MSVDGGNPITDLALDVVSLYAPTRSAIGRRYPGVPVEDAMRAAHAEGADDVVVTDGSAGALVLIAGDAVHVPAFDGRIVSTMGAGDVFHGGLVAALVHGDDLPAAVRRASATAMISCRALDGRSGIPTLEELDAFLAAPRQGR
nr:PfkB family carbohydrate kinase [Microbacterium pseudoresistens]